MTKRLMDQFNLSGRTALVTGGASGIGKEYARILAEAGASVMIAARNEERLKLVSAELSTETGSRVIYQKVDLAKRNEAEALVHDAQKAMGGLDILVANAATDLYAGAADFKDEGFDDVMTVNFASNVWMTRAAVPPMREKKWGRIIYVSSIAATVGLKQVKLGLYAASKAALESYARFVAAEVGTDGITCNCIVPGAVVTVLSDGFKDNYGDATDEDKKTSDAAALAWVHARNPLNRRGQTKELAGALLLLASDAGAFITGARYVVDGGWASFGDTSA